MATFGKTTDGSGETSSSAHRKKVSSAVPASSGTATSITIRGRVTIENTVIKGVVYADSSGAPGALIAVSDEITVNSTTAQDWTGNITFDVVSGTTYWIGFHQQDPGTGGFAIRRDGTASASQTNTDTYSDGPTDPFGTPTAESGKIACYVTYTEDTGTNMQINIGDTWKTVTGVQINIGDTWKTVTKVQINIGDTWKTVF